MDEGFNYAAPAKRPARLGAPRPPRGPRTSVSAVTVAAVGLGLAAAAVLLFVLLRGAGRAGEDVADARSETVAAVDRANDAAAQATIGRAVVAARTAWADAGAFPTDVVDFADLEPGVTFTTDASTGPGVVAVSVDAATFAAAVRSRSGTCWWVKLDASGTTTYGSGGTCTGQAARAAAAPSW